MARSARLIVPGQPHHIYQQGNNREHIFADEKDYLLFIGWLKEASRHSGVDIHAYALLENSFHLLATPADETGMAQMMQWLGRRYVPYFNGKYDRTGTLWQGRFKTSVVEVDDYLMKCSRFIEMRPVFCGLASEPDSYRWSSYAHHAGLRSDPLIRDHAVYWKLGNTPFAREAAYRNLFTRLPQIEKNQLHTVLLKGWPLGSEAFIRQLEASTKRPFRMGKRGRPIKKEV